MNVEIWSDVVCPWCYIGKRRFEAALAGFEHRNEVSVVWRSFELDPTAPQIREPDAAMAHYAQKFGTSEDEVRARRQHVAELATADGLHFRHDIARGGNTFDAHRLLHLAAEHGLQDALKERLMLAYHSEGEAIGDPAALAPLALEVGLDEDEVRELLAGDRFAEAVREDERTASALGITGVPFFVGDRALAVSGAQSTEVFREFLERAWEARSAAALAV